PADPDHHGWRVRGGGDRGGDRVPVRGVLPFGRSRAEAARGTAGDPAGVDLDGVAVVAGGGSPGRWLLAGAAGGIGARVVGPVPRPADGGGRVLDLARSPAGAAGGTRGPDLQLRRLVRGGDGARHGARRCASTLVDMVPS